MGDSEAIFVDPLVQGTPPRKRRRAARTALACTACRHRKIRCSGDWPTCSACLGRKCDCVYPSQPLIAARTRISHANGDGLSDDEHDPTIDELPAEDLRRRAISHFREHYAASLLCFIPPQQLIEDDTGNSLPWPLLLCIIVLASRSLPEVFACANLSSSASDHYAALARRSLRRTYEEPSLTTVQCCLIMCVYEIGEGSEKRGWLRLGHAVRMAQLLQLHKQDAKPSLMDWANSPPSTSATMSESKRRTLWCCFCLERLLANGRDRIATLVPEDITTELPQSDENFIYGRHEPAHTLAFLEPGSRDVYGRESLMSLTIRVINILSAIMVWHGRGGRHSDPRCPWLPDMPFTLLDDALSSWESTVPQHFKYTKLNTFAVIATGQGQLWSLMWMVYFQALVYLHREYIPFTPTRGYDPVNGPCDGPVLEPRDFLPPENFWYRSATVMIESANAITDLYHTIKTRQPSESMFPLYGFGLFTAASVHVMYSIFGWESLIDVVTQETSRRYLKLDMDAFNHLGQRWSLAIHWIRQVSLFYKLNSLAKRSWVTGAQTSISTMNIRSIKDGIMNYVRQVSPKDREMRNLNLQPTFDFEGWLCAIERTIGEDIMLGPDSQPQIDAEQLSTERTDMSFFDFESPGFLSLDEMTAIPWLHSGDELILGV